MKEFMNYFSHRNHINACYLLVLQRFICVGWYITARISQLTRWLL